MTAEKRLNLTYDKKILVDADEQLNQNTSLRKSIKFPKPSKINATVETVVKRKTRAGLNLTLGANDPCTNAFIKPADQIA